MMKTEVMSQADLVPLWKALADAKRRRIIQLLGEKSRTTGEICAYFDVSRFAIMRHLGVLEQAGLISTRREGRQRWNFLNEELFQQIQHAYLENHAGGEYQLNEVLSFLVRQEERWPVEGVSSEPPVIEHEITLQAAPERVYRALTGEVDGWWSYRVSVNSHVYLEPHLGGRFYEAFDGGGGALYALVTFIKPGEEIRLSGSMGLADAAVNNLVQFTLRPQDVNAACLRLIHRFPESVSAVTLDSFMHSWNELLNQQLRSYVEQEAST